MPSVAAELQRLQFLVSKGRGEEPCHVVLPAEEAKKRIANDGPKPRTRFTRELDSPQAYSEMNAEWDRYISCCINKTVAVSVMLAVLKSRSDDELRKMANDD